MTARIRAAAGSQKIATMVTAIRDDDKMTPPPDDTFSIFTPSKVSVVLRASVLSSIYLFLDRSIKVSQRPLTYHTLRLYTEP